MAIRTMDSRMISEGVELIDFITHVGEVKNFLKKYNISPEYKSQWEAAIRKFIESTDAIAFVIRDMEKQHND